MGVGVGVGAWLRACECGCECERAYVCLFVCLLSRTIEIARVSIIICLSLESQTKNSVGSMESMIRPHEQDATTAWALQTHEMVLDSDLYRALFVCFFGEVYDHFSFLLPELRLSLHGILARRRRLPCLAFDRVVHILARLEFTVAKRTQL